MQQMAVFRSRILPRIAGSMLVAAAVSAPPVAADWLVTRDGARVETRGPWEVKGRQVVFTLKNGTLSALRLADVDLDASAAATAESRAPAAAAEAEAEVERKPVLVLTNKDVRRAAPSAGSGEPAAEGEAEGEGGEAAPAAPALSEGDVVVDSWKASLSRQTDGLELAGVVRNNGSAVVAKVTLTVTVPDGQGGTLYETNAFLRNAGLAPGGSTTFRALLPGVFQLPEDPIFEVDAATVTLGTAPAEPAAEGEGEGEAGGG